MKVKYYMRGLGIGIILTTFILTMNGNKEKLSDEEIKRLAIGLGMVMQDKQNVKDVLDDMNQAKPSSDPVVTPEPTDATAPDSDAEVTVTPEPTDNPEITEAPEPTPTPDITEAPEPTNKPDQSDGTTDNTEDEDNVQPDKITFSIVGGMSSGKVATHLQEIGLVDDAEKFNKYIVKVGKADVINVGTFTVTKGATYEEIIKVITQ
jgi:hypothetical protein